MAVDPVSHRDQVLRAYFSGRDWDASGEFALKRKLVMEGMPGYPYLFDDEWEVVPGHADQGCGDLVFVDKQGRAAIVEVKYLDKSIGGRTGRTRRVSNRKKRRKVEEQAIRYAEIFASALPPAMTVEAYIYTNEHDAPVLLGSLPGSRREDEE